jgi:hypothetical protein
MKRIAHYKQKSQSPIQRMPSAFFVSDLNSQLYKASKILFSHKFYIAVILMEKLRPATCFKQSGWADRRLFISPLVLAVKSLN